MEKEFFEIKKLLTGKWIGEGFAKFPTIEDSRYTEEWEFEANEDMPAIRFNQKTWYKNEKKNNGKTAFEDTGFIVLKSQKILLVSAQISGRIETYELTNYKDHTLTFDSVDIENDAKTIRSQRIITVNDSQLNYELNMSTHQATTFQNHLSASLRKSIQ